MVRSPMDANSDGFDAEFEIALDTSQLSSVRSQLLEGVMVGASLRDATSHCSSTMRLFEL